MKNTNKADHIRTVGSDRPSRLLPTKSGYEYFVLITKPRDMSWIAVNNKLSKEAEDERFSQQGIG